MNHTNNSSSYTQDNLYFDNRENKEYSINDYTSGEYLEKDHYTNHVGSSGIDFKSSIIYNNHNHNHSSHSHNIDDNEYNMNNYYSSSSHYNKDLINTNQNNMITFENDTKEMNSSKGSVVLPKHPKVFSRRIGNRRSQFKTGSSYNEKAGSNNSSSRRNRNDGTFFVKRNGSRNSTNSSKYSQRLLNESNDYNPNTIRSSINNPSTFKKAYNSISSNISNAQNIQHRSLNDIPLCVQEMGTNIIQTSHMPLHSLNHDEYYMNHYLNDNLNNINYLQNNNAMPLRLKLNPEKLIRLMQILFKCMYKTLRLVIVKIRSEFDTREFVGADYKISSLPNLDIACDVCEKTEEERVRLGLKKKDPFTYFEEPDQPSKFIKNLWGTLNNWIDLNEKDTITFETRRNKKNEMDLFYKVGKFPKDKDGKVELPEFEKISKKEL